ncbi:carbohydrate ABC transporter permease [Xylanimonas protaetiae]|uniref:Sugar ABC transporter permease n=1 Tax=Xylanimonas protaetiae TaxID=2509457 RepID=A0A4P6FDF0_9MICO|nr:sugar ABC transporter permease [Xylanimonas protaetiae]QAY71647.1 sugar ABC transporter permease [Xylanimonas protaetiae]
MATATVAKGAPGETLGAPPRPIRRFFDRHRNTLGAMAFISPWIIGFLVFTAWPMIYSFYLSLTDFDNINPPRFAGLANYRAMISDHTIPQALWNTFHFAIMSVPATIIVGLLLAMLLQRASRGNGFFRTVFFLPRMTPQVAVGVLFLMLFNGSRGIINQILGWFGITGPQWTVDSAWIRPGLVLMGLWTVGNTAIILLAALKDVPRELYESARVDGASSLRQFWSITLPLISPQIFFVFIVNSIASLQTFTEAYTAFFGNQANFSNDAALFYAIHIFETAFRNFRMGYASAMAWVLFLIIMIITAIQWRVSKRFVFYGGGGDE